MGIQEERIVSRVADELQQRADAGGQHIKQSKDFLRQIRDLVNARVKLNAETKSDQDENSIVDVVVETFVNPPPPPPPPQRRPWWIPFAVAGGVGTAVALAAPLALGLAGFGASGIVAGSAAAAWQSSIGNVAAGSLFAFLQSCGAAGAGGAAAAAGAATGAVSGAAAAAVTAARGPRG